MTNVNKVRNDGTGMSRNAFAPYLSRYADLFSHCKDDTIAIKTHERLKAMKNNDSCVCGSELPYSHCCPDISKESILAELIVKTQLVDEAVQSLQLKQKVRYICKKGCNDCCSEYFYISMLEYFLIKHELTKQNRFGEVQARAMADYDELCHSYPKEVNKLNGTNEIADVFSDKEYLGKFKPCPILDPDGACECYRLRPLICRLYGQTNIFASCNKLFEKCRLPFSNKVWQWKAQRHVVTARFDMNYLSENVDVFSFNGKTIVTKPFPLIYWLANDADYFDAYFFAATRSKEDFIRFICK